jgi:hypothetical protein
VLRKEFGSLLVRARWSSRSRISTVASGIAAASQKRVSRSPPVRSRALNLVFARSLLSTRRSTCQRCCFARTAGRGALLHLGEQQPSCGPISSLLRTTSERASRAPRHCCYARHATVPTGSDFAPAPMGKRHSGQSGPLPMGGYRNHAKAVAGLLPALVPLLPHSDSALVPIGSSHAPTSCLCTGCHGPNQAARLLIVPGSRLVSGGWDACSCTPTGAPVMSENCPSRTHRCRSGAGYGLAQRM